MDKDTLLKNVNNINGINGSMLVSKDGLVLANALPESTDPNLVSAVLSSMFTNIDVQSKRMQRGNISREKTLITKLILCHIFERTRKCYSLSYQDRT